MFSKCGPTNHQLTVIVIVYWNRAAMLKQSKEIGQVEIKSKQNLQCACFLSVSILAWPPTWRAHQWNQPGVVRTSRHRQEPCRSGPQEQPEHTRTFWFMKSSTWCNSAANGLRHPVTLTLSVCTLRSRHVGWHLGEISPWLHHLTHSSLPFCYC